MSDFNFASGCTSHQSYCKGCDSDRKKEYAKNNADKVREAKKEYHIANREDRNRKSGIYQKQQKDKVNEYRRKRYQTKKDELSAYAKAARAKNKKVIPHEEVAAKKAAAKIKRRENKRVWANMKSATDVTFKILKKLRSRTRFALKRDGGEKFAATEELLGCSISEFKYYFEGLFTEGMTWEHFLNGNIHIDHKKPCVLFDLSKEEEQRTCFFYKNLQPLWGVDNLKKGIKIIL